MKKLLTLFTMLVAFQLIAGPNQTLGQLGAKGVSEKGGDPKYAKYIPRTNDDGELDISFISATALFPANSKYYYVDDASGSDTEGNGSAAAPFKTIGKAISQNVTDGASPLVIFLFPGTYSSATTITNVNQTQISIIGLQSTISGTMNLNTTGTTVQIDFFGTTVTSDIIGAGAGSTFNINTFNKADLSSVIQSTATVNVNVSPGSSVLVSGGGNVTYDVKANESEYSAGDGADWSPEPDKVNDALDQLAERTVELETNGTTIGENIGTAGVGIYKQKTDNKLELYKLDGSDDNIISIVLDGGTNEINFSIVDNSIANAKLAPMDQYHLKGHISTANGTPEDITPAQLNTILEEAGGLRDVDFDANTILKADVDDTPLALTVPEQTLIGRITGETIDALTPAEVRTLINVEDGANNYSHPNHTGQVTSDGDGDTTIQPGVVTNAMLANMPEWSVKVRNAAGAGVPSDAASGDLTEEATPATGDWILGWLSTGELRKFDFGNIVDPNAIHDNTGGEINAVAAKAAPVGADVILIEDSEATFAKKKATLTSLGAAITLSDDSVTNAKLAEMPAWTIKMNNTGSAANPQDIDEDALTADTPVKTDSVLGFKADNTIKKFSAASFITEAYSTAALTYSIPAGHAKTLVVFIDLSSNNVNFTLPAASDFIKMHLIVKDNALTPNTLTITGTINETVNPTLSTKYSGMELISDGTNIYTISDTTP